MTDNPMGMAWDQVEGFVRHEFAPPHPHGGDWDMDASLIFMLGAIRKRAIKRRTNAQVIIHKNGGFAYEGHASKSLHYKGRAVDFHINVPRETQGNDLTVEWERMPVIELAVIVYEMTDDRYGLGVYSWGVHLDYRADVEDRTDATWYRDLSGEYHFSRHKDFYITIAGAFTDNENLTKPA
jgi:hypothetical protein